MKIKKHVFVLPSWTDGSSSCSRNIFRMLLIVTSCFLVQCQNQEDPPPPGPGPQQAETAPSKSQGPLGSGEPGATSSPSQPSASNVLTNTETADSTCCEIVANPDLKGRLGRLVVKFPEGANPGSTRIEVFKPGEQKALIGDFGGHIFELLPGDYDITISKKRLAGVAIQSAHDTRVKVGVLQVYAGGSTRVDVLDRDGEPTLAGGFGNQTIGLPVGTFQVQVAGQAEPVTIEDNQVTEF